ncbi:male-specific histamine-binding salivary protein-like [Dermacentor silvarum]|uniref:male-specific histamine-binding salivary protein-like n=1 Tax=Dermacentor silvarum TaxID=543639 RepID=UPI0021007B37|nr:male-specific histamine-binding salivary protein-like [Dermacentor silvarum]
MPSMKLLNQKEDTRYFLLQSTFRDKPHFWGRNFKCVTARHTPRNPKEKTALSIFQYVGVHNFTFTVSKEVKAVTHYGYTKPNALEYHLTGNRILIELVMFSNGGTCNLLSVPYLGTKLGCELWVIESSIDKVPACCLFMFRLLCPKNAPYNVYDNTCKSVLNRRKAPRK